MRKLIATGFAMCSIAVADLGPIAAQERSEAFVLKAGDRIRIYPAADAWPSPLVEGRFWLVDPDRGLLLRMVREVDTFFRRDQIDSIEAWQVAGDSRRVVWLAAGVGALVGALQGARFPSEGEPHAGMIALGALGGAGLGFVVGTTLRDDKGSWRELTLADVFDP